jgi:hypothetical protein
MRLALLLALGAPAGGDYLPLEAGTRWVYEVGSASTLAPDAPEPAREVTSEVKAAATLPDGEWTELSNFLGYETCWARTTDTAVEIRTEAVEHAPVLSILRLPARAGDAWSGTLGREDVSFVVAGEQTLDDGRRALRVDFNVASGEKHAGHAATRGALWFERGTGLVKASITKDLDCHSATTTVYRLKREPR